MIWLLNYPTMQILTLNVGGLIDISLDIIM